jgi:hypothetical protein
VNADWLTKLKSKLDWSTLKSTTSMLRDEVTAFFWVPRGGTITSSRRPLRAPVMAQPYHVASRPRTFDMHVMLQKGRCSPNAPFAGLEMLMAERP